MIEQLTFIAWIVGTACLTPAVWRMHVNMIEKEGDLFDVLFGESASVGALGFSGFVCAVEAAFWPGWLPLVGIGKVIRTVREANQDSYESKRVVRDPEAWIKEQEGKL